MSAGVSQLMALWLSNCSVLSAFAQSCAPGYCFAAAIEAGGGVASVIVCGGGVGLRAVNADAIIVAGSAEGWMGLKSADLIFWVVFVGRDMKIICVVLRVYR